MKRTIYFYCIGILLILASACCGKKGKNFLIDLDNPSSTKELKLSELADDIKCIPLETTEEFLLPDNSTHYWVSDKYIITLSNVDIRQFSPEGKYIRKLASAGKGPDEYNYIMVYTVDEINDILYYGHTGDRQHITAIDLKTGKHIGKIQTRSFPEAIQTVHGNILYTYNNTTQSGIFLVNQKGEILDSLPYTFEAAKSFALSGVAPIQTLVPTNEDEIFIKRNDTLFTFDFRHSEPLIAFQYTDKFNMETHLKGIHWKALFKNKNCVIVQKQTIDMERNGAQTMVGMRSEGIFLIDLHTSKPQKIEKLYMDPLEKDYDGFFSFKLTGKKLLYPVSAFAIKELVRTKQENGEPVPPALRQLDGLLTEESNPVLITGTLK